MNHGHIICRFAALPFVCRLKGEEIIMAKYILMLRDHGTYEGLSAEEMQKIIGRYRAWSGKLRETGKIVSGEKLRDRQGRVMKRSGSNLAVTDGPFAEAKEIIGGFSGREALWEILRTIPWG